MGASKKELCAGSIYYLCLLLNSDITTLKDDTINKIFDVLYKLDYTNLYILFHDLETIYKLKRRG